jgi:hypothetical protein
MQLLGRVFGLLLIASAASAQDNADQLAKCAAFETPALRLTCYDDLAKGAADTSSSSSQEAAADTSSGSSQTGEPNTSMTESPEELSADEKRLEKWVMKMETDPITDQKGATFLLIAENASRGDTPTLVIRCKKGDLDVLFGPDDYLGSNNDRVTLRFGSEPPVKERWNESSNHSALFVPGSREKVEAFVRKLTQYPRLAIQVQPYNEAPQAMVFDLTGITQVVEELRKVCPPKSK